MNRHPVIVGTLILTATGFLCRILGFFYRIFLSRTIGAQGLGLYQMIFPIHGIAFALCAGSIQTAVSQLVAAGASRGRSVLRAGLFISLSISAALTAAIFTFREFLAAQILLEPACAPLLPIMALSIPFSAVHACICGYYYGLKKTKVPALSQVAEQLVRMAFALFTAHICMEQGREITVSLAVWALLMGEAASAVCCLLALGCARERADETGGGGAAAVPGNTEIPGDGAKAKVAAADKDAATTKGTASGKDDAAGKGIAADKDTVTDKDKDTATDKDAATDKNTAATIKAAAPPVPEKKRFLLTASALMALALPLMGSRLILNILQSLEAIFIPNRLTVWGLSGPEALSVYGILTGMALPFILFPSAITNSLAVMLLPSVAEAQAAGDGARIRRSVETAVRYSLYMGILCVGIFTVFGNPLGRIVFHSPDAGSFIVTLAWLCPFMYLATTMGSILNGLGETKTTFTLNAVSMLLRLAFAVFLIPIFGIAACLWGMLISEMLLALLCALALKRRIHFSINAASSIAKPILCLAAAVGILLAMAPLWQRLSRPMAGGNGASEFLLICVQAAALCAAYAGMLALLHKN